MADREPAHPAPTDRPEAAASADRRAQPRQRPGTVAGVVERNIASLLEHRRADDRARTRHERLTDWVTRVTGSMAFVYAHLVAVVAWVVTNRVPRLPHFDPHFDLLAMIASVEAIFLATFVLIAQNRMQAHADRRADLDLQISLLAEHEVTRTIALVREIARRMGIEQASDPALDELQQQVEPLVVLETMAASQARILDRHPPPAGPADVE